MSEIAAFAGTNLQITRSQDFFNDAQTASLVQMGLGNAPRGDIEVFFHACKRTGLDPFARQIYMIERRAKQNGEWISKWTIQTGIDGFRVIRDRPGVFEGLEEHWCGEDGIWLDVWTAKTPPVAARITLYINGFVRPITAVAKYDEYVPLRNGEPTGQWGRMPTLMTSKVAEALAYRKAFPQDFSGIYTDDEMDQATDHSVTDGDTQVAPQSAALPPATKRATTGKQGTRRRKASDVVDAEPVAQVDVAAVAEPEAAEAEVVDAVVVDDQPAAAPVAAPAPPVQAALVQAAEDPAIAAERAERERMAAEQTRQVTEREARIATAADVDRADATAVAAWNAENGKATGHFITSDAELAAKAARLAAPDAAPEAPAAAPVPMYVDPTSGDVLEAQAAIDVATPAEEPPYVEPSEDEGTPTPLEVAIAEEPTNWDRQVAAATTVPELKAIWMEAARVVELTNDLRLAINTRKTAIEQPANA